MQKILILAALPDRLRLDREIREIKNAVERAVKRDLFEIKIITAVRPQDIRRAIAQERPEIVHFCGHGMEDGSLVLEDDGGDDKPVSPEGLAELFKLHADYVKCVLLNVCYSDKTAQAISKKINYSIGMNQPIEDKTAIVFAQGFYDGLGYDNINNFDIIQRAFDEGIVAIKLENLLHGSIPVLWKRGITQEKPESIVTEISGSQNNDGISNWKTEISAPELNHQPTIENNKKVFEPQKPSPIKRDDSDDSLSSEKGVDYIKLRDLLAAGKWKEADQETLAIMLIIAGRKMEGWLDIQSINDFPCTDLCTIDRLWVKYSNEKFGFSVQKRIWENVGGGEFSEETWVSFGERVGWRTTKYHQVLFFHNWTSREWSYYSQINFNLDAPEGHLPRMWDEWRGGLEVSALVMRVETCNIKHEPTQIDSDINHIQFAPPQTGSNVELKGYIHNPSSGQEIDYTHLQNFLASKNWKDADQETQRIMLKLAKREKEGWLDIQSVDNFNSTDLNTINQLWVKYSCGHFGLNVQKHIWQYVQESEEAFGYRVGWRVLSKWIYHHNLTFSLDAPPGHLPFWGRGWSDGRLWVKEVQISQWAHALLSRQELS